MKKVLAYLSSTKARVVDYGIGVSCIGYGVYTTEWWAAGLGVIGLGLTHFKVAQKLSDRIIKAVGAPAKVDHSQDILAARAAHEEALAAQSMGGHGEGAQTRKEQDGTPSPEAHRKALMEQAGGLKYQAPMLYYTQVAANPYKNNLLHRSSSNLYSKGVPFC